MIERDTDRQTGRQTDGQTDRQTDRQTERETERKRERERERWRQREGEMEMLTEGALSLLRGSGLGVGESHSPAEGEEEGRRRRKTHPTTKLMEDSDNAMFTCQCTHTSYVHTHLLRCATSQVVNLQVASLAACGSHFLPDPSPIGWKASENFMSSHRT